VNRGLLVHLLLFVLTVVSTYFAHGTTYSVCMITILLCHEMGHYLTSRRYGISTTLPYFLPFPFSPFGTLGAVIKMKGAINSKKALFDIGVAGPLSGFIVSLPCVFVGLQLSRPVRTSAVIQGSLSLGDSLLMRLAQKMVVGDLPRHYDLLLHPVAFAGWAGLFITGLNLLPVGQLDGGHIIYALFGNSSKWVYRSVIGLLLVLSVFYNGGWLLLALLLLIFGVRHPRPVDALTPLDRKRKVLGVLMLLMFVVSFVPAPVAGGSLIDWFRLLSK
jgi:membrane-associated protease RseP (regulator of RpoE activity)